MLKKIVNINTVVSLLSSITVLLSIFVLTMLNHYDGNMDWNYLWYAFIRIFILSLIPVFVVVIFKIGKWYWSIITGVCIGLISAVIYVNVATIIQ